MRSKKKPGPIVPLSAYVRLGYECQRCKTGFVSKTGPEVFCETCRKVLAGQASQHKSDGGPHGA